MFQIYFLVVIMCANSLVNFRWSTVFQISFPWSFITVLKEARQEEHRTNRWEASTSLASIDYTHVLPGSSRSPCSWPHKSERHQEWIIYPCCNWEPSDCQAISISNLETPSEGCLGNIPGWQVLQNLNLKTGCNACVGSSLRTVTAPSPCAPLRFIEASAQPWV